ncbi:helix-turn-helix domain-containing protein [Methyloceanibacter sp.]|uniref:helix-turn-helix domain-containing protein n=1 Tax=Methyloceanibacter sp. TaxID=1965321 RepID=UPI002D0D3D36|nr:helix-turn-helix domain-containing protein [Methyloceanibacter sp.]HML92219.1 helix-turn-helix domain-containing protein [Methyloceanibacter sp.]
MRRLTYDEEQAEALTRGRKTFAEAVDDTLKSNPCLSGAAVFDRIKDALGCDTDAELAWVLGTSPQSLWNRKKRNAVPYREAVYVSLVANISLDYLLLGKE